MVCHVGGKNTVCKGREGVKFSNEKELREFIQHEVLFTSEAADLLNCTRQHIYNLVKQGKLDPVKATSNDRIFLKSDILYLKELKGK